MTQGKSSKKVNWTIHTIIIESDMPSSQVYKRIPLGDEGYSTWIDESISFTFSEPMAIPFR